MNKLRDFVLPIAIVLGLIFHSYCLAWAKYVPYLIFSILLLNFVSVDLKKMKLSWLDLWLVLFQIVVSLGGYLLLRLFGADEIIAEGVLVGVLCPVAASVVVISCILGANRETVTTYTILGNLMVTIVAPIYFSFIGVQQDMPFFESFWLIFSKVAPIIALPFIIAIVLQHCLPKVNSFIAKYRGLSFYLWAVALFVTLGQTIDFMFQKGEENLTAILWLGGVSIVFCAIQFGFGKWLGSKYGDRIAGGQLLGQRNSAMGIWLANMYLNPLAAVFPALYSVWQNLFNSWQLWMHDRKK